MDVKIEKKGDSAIVELYLRCLNPAWVHGHVSVEWDRILNDANRTEERKEIEELLGKQMS